jgi:hypothetical protein
MKQITLKKVNGKSIQVIEADGMEYVPVKPICDALGLTWDSQYRKLQKRKKPSSVIALRAMTGSDGKQYQMVCIPLKYVFGWLFTINPENVREEAREAVEQYADECYDVLYRYFTEQSIYLEEKTE